MPYKSRVLFAVAVIGSIGLVTAQSAWLRRTPSVAPSARGSQVLEDDLQRGRAGLFGGWATSDLNDTWEWDGTVWAQQLPTHSPLARDGAAYGYDLLRSRVVIFGGNTTFGNLADTWEWDGTDWQQIVTGAAPTARVLAGMA